MAKSDIFEPVENFNLLFWGLLALFTILPIYLAFKAKTWDKAMLKTDISGKVDSIDPNEVKQGDTGKTVSRLAPIGKIIINEKYYEGKSIDSFIDHGVDIEVVKVEMTQIIVKPKK